MHSARLDLGRPRGLSLDRPLVEPESFSPDDSVDGQRV